MHHPFDLVLASPDPERLPTLLPDEGFAQAWAAITAWPGYRPTRLMTLGPVADALGLGQVWWKDEGERFGLGSFKALGGAYAVGCALLARLEGQGIPATQAELDSGALAPLTARVTVCCATDGNHGRSVAWGAQRFGCPCVIFLHEGVSQGREAAIARFGAAIRRVPGTYDDSVRAAAETAAREGWIVVSDTAWEGYTAIPTDVMQGYRIMADEAAGQMPLAPTHAFVPGGVGGAAAAVAVQLFARFPDAPPRIVVVEPTEAACLLASARAGRLVAVMGALETIMAGLACGEPSPLAWPLLERLASAFVALPDSCVAPAMRSLAGFGVVAGESAAPVLAALEAVSGDADARTALGLGPESRVLLFGTEGATDPALYRSIVGVEPERVSLAG